jgi:hypothetical protein
MVFSKSDSFLTLGLVGIFSTYRFSLKTREKTCF